MTEAMRLIWEPGNGTRYELCVTRFEGPLFGCSEGGFVVVGPFPDKLRAMVVPTDMDLHFTYVMEKMGLGEIDASCVTVMLGKALDVEAWPTDSEWYTRGIQRPFVPPVTTLR